MSSLKSLLIKRAISATEQVPPPGQDFVAGFPASPATSIARPEVLEAARRTPKDVNSYAGGGVGLAISESMRSFVDEIERKWASDPFMMGVAHELEKFAVSTPLKKMVGVLKAKMPTPPPFELIQKTPVKQPGWVTALKARVKVKKG